jgi:hypothetical protein
MKNIIIWHELISINIKYQLEDSIIDNVFIFVKRLRIINDYWIVIIVNNNKIN